MSGFRLSSTVIAAPDPRALAACYRSLLDWETRDDEPDWVVLKPRGTGQGAATGLAFQRETEALPLRLARDKGFEDMVAKRRIDPGTVVDHADLDDGSRRFSFNQPVSGQTTPLFSVP